MTDNDDVERLRLRRLLERPEIWRRAKTHTHYYTLKEDWAVADFDWWVAFIRANGYKFPHDPSHRHGDKKPRYYNIGQGERCDTYWVIHPFDKINRVVKPALGG